MTEGDRIAEKYQFIFGDEDLMEKMAAEINAVLSAERELARGLAEALQKIVLKRRTYGGKLCKDEAADIAQQALAYYKQKENTK